MAKIDQPLILSIRENYERQELIRWDFYQTILLKQRKAYNHIKVRINSGLVVSRRLQKCDF